MIDAVTAVMGLVSGGVFLAHAFEDYRTRGTHHLVPTGPAPKSLLIRASIVTGRCIMRNHDLVSSGFLAVTAAGLMLLCSSLLAFGFS